MKINFKPLTSLVAAFKARLATHVAAEDKGLVKRVTKSSTRVSDHGVGGYRVHSPITDWNEVEKELDKAKKILGSIMVRRISNV